MAVGTAAPLDEATICLAFGAISTVKIFEKIEKISKLYGF